MRKSHHYYTDGCYTDEDGKQVITIGKELGHLTSNHLCYICSGGDYPLQGRIIEDVEIINDEKAIVTLGHYVKDELTHAVSEKAEITLYGKVKKKLRVTMAFSDMFT